MASLIVINGAPGVGKTTLLKWLAPKLDMPAIAKDDFKDFLFDRLGYSDRDWSRILGRASVEMLYDVADEFLNANKSIIIENAFWPEYSKQPLAELANKHKATLIEVYCSADDEVRMQRFRDRAEGGQRHDGHVDNLATLRDVTQYGPLAIGDVIEVDLTHAETALYEHVYEQLAKLMMEDNNA